MAIEELKGNASAPAFSVDRQDNAGEARSAVSIMQKQIIGSPDIYISGVNPQTMAIKDQVGSRAIPLWVWIFDSDINANSKVKNNFRTYLNFKVEPPLLFEYAKRKKPNCSGLRS
jgi:hypothetical protein